MNLMDKKIQICITDDHELFAEGIAAILSNEIDMDVCAIVKNKMELLQIMGKHKPDIVLLDVKLPDGNGLDLIPVLKNDDNTTKVIVISTYSDVHTVNKSIKNDADAFLLKSSSKKILCNTIRDVYEGKKCFQEIIGNQFSKTDYQYFSALYKITKREFQIMEMIKQGKSNNQISKELFISVYTTETHRKNVMQKLGLKTPSALLLFLVQEM
jgi:two-component system nitrate/nitrite response regulator NarL